jgi:uncharacterized membrane protein YgaE (UPF0421/DUF939 family)
MKLGRPQRFYLQTVALWAVIVVVHACWHIAGVLSGTPDPEVYANTVGFQVIAYTLTRLPYFVIGLAIVLLVEFVLFNRKGECCNIIAHASFADLRW